MDSDDVESEVELKSLVHQEDDLPDAEGGSCHSIVNQSRPSKQQSTATNYFYLVLVLGAVLAVALSGVAVFHKPKDDNGVAHISTEDTKIGSAHSNVTFRQPTTIKGVFHDKEYEFSDVAIQQIQSYREGSGLLLNLHITHHAGTTICRRVGRVRGAPGLHCNHPKPEDNATDFPNYDPWEHNMTSTNIRLAKKYYNFIAWEHNHAPVRPFTETNWQDPNLVSLIVMRDPISRLLAGDGDVSKNYPHVLHGNATHDEWWEYANSTHLTNNFALSILAGNKCCNGADTKREHLLTAKVLLRQFTFILDIACLDEGLSALSDVLGLPLHDRQLQDLRDLGKSHVRKPSSERIGYRDIYEYLLEKNKVDIELYQWSKKRSLVVCPPKN